KTGTVENSLRGIKQKDHAFFAAFAPRRNPRIAIAVICENAGFGSTSAAPIASLMIEKYLTDSIAGKERKARLEQVSNLNLLPPRMVKEIRRRDSIIHARDAAYLIAKGYIKEVKDTLKLEDDGVEIEDLEKLKNQQPLKKMPVSDSTDLKIEAILPNDTKRIQKADSSNNNN
ncbi:MAG: hypothetical protein WD135_01790, partial [Ferruginibacter sp.]